jgi:Fic family protein
MSLQILLDNINSKIKELDSLRPIDPELMKVIMDKLYLEQDYNSNNIEGNSLTLQETRSLLLHDLVIGKAKRMRDYEEVKGHHKAILELKNIVKENQPITQNLIRNLNQTLLVSDYYRPSITPTGETVQRLIQAGVYKTHPNHVQTVTGEIYKFAEPFEVPSKIDDLLNWLEFAKDINIIELIAKFHHDFITIHPFDDGNGRTCRLLINLILQSNKYPPIWIPTEDKENYYNALRIADAGDINVLEEYLGERLLESLNITIRGAKGENLEIITN